MAKDSDDHKFSGNYLVLRPEDVGFYDIFCILWNDEIKKRAFVDFPNGKEENLTCRWIIFISLLSQKILQLKLVVKFFQSFGSSFENWLNLISCNHNIFILFRNYLQGNVVRPVKGSETFLSINGHLDSRVHLGSIKSGPNCRYYGAISVMAAKLSYENKDYIKNTVINQWKMEFLLYEDFWNDFQEKHTTQAFMLHDKTVDPDIVVVAFRGTEPFDVDAWCTDCDVSWYELEKIGKVHGGFMKALGLLMKEGWPQDVEKNEKRPIAYYVIREKLREIINQNERTKFIVTGHSLGGALAVLFPAVLAVHEEELLLKRLEGIYTFGQPRVGNEEFAMFMQEQMEKYGFKYLRFVYSNDVVPRLPTDDSTFLFKHFGTCLYYNSCYHGQIVQEEPDKNFKSLFGAINRFLVAIWELIRSFIIPYTKGLDYGEGWFLKLLRWYGLLFPGLSAHNLQDYVNITRLGPDTIYSQLEDPKFRSFSDLGT